MEPDTDVRITRGRAALWTIHPVALLILATCFAYGTTLYDSLPERVPTHWGIGNAPDEWAAKSFGSVFAPLLVGAGVSVFLALISAAVPLLASPNPAATGWELWRREGMVRGTVAGLGGASVLLAALISFVSVFAWRTPDHLPAGPVAVLVLLMLAVIFGAYALASRWAGRTALKNGVTPTAGEQEEDKLWIAGGLYNNPGDPRILVPKRPGSGTGLTVNLGHPKGRAAVVVFLALFVVLPLALAF